MAGQLNHKRLWFNGSKVTWLPVTGEVEVSYQQWLPLLHSMMATKEDRDHLSTKLLPRVARMTIQHSRIFMITKDDTFFVYFSRNAFVYPRNLLNLANYDRRGDVRQQLKMSDLAACNELRKITELCGRSIVKVGSTIEKIFALSSNGRMYVWGLDFSIEKFFDANTNNHYKVKYESLFPRPLELVDQDGVPVLDFALQLNRLVLLHLGQTVATVLDVDTFAEVIVSLTELNKDFGFCPYVLFVQARAGLIESDVTDMIMSVTSELKEGNDVDDDDPDKDFEFYYQSIVQLDVMRVIRLDWRCRLIIESFIFMLTNTGQVYMVPTNGTMRPFRRLAFERLLINHEDIDDDLSEDEDSDEFDDEEDPRVFITGFIVDRMQRRILAISDNNRLFEYWQEEDFMLLVESIDTNKVLTPGEWMLMAASMVSCTSRIYFDQMLLSGALPLDGHTEPHLFWLEPLESRFICTDSRVTFDVFVRQLVTGLLAVLEAKIQAHHQVRVVIDSQQLANLLKMFDLDQDDINQHYGDVIRTILNRLENAETKHFLKLWNMLTTNQSTLNLIKQNVVEICSLSLPIAQAVQ